MRGWCIGVAFLVGCSSPRAIPADAGGRDGAREIDSSVADAIDSSLADAALDAAIDAPIDAPPGVPGSVTVTVYDVNGDPAASMPVVFLNADDSVVSTTMTNAAGVAAATMVAGGSVTAQRPRPPGIAGDWIYTYLGVKPGDDLVVGDPAVVVPTTFQATLVVPTKANAAFFNVETNCGAGGSVGSTSIVATLSCNSVDVLVTASDSNGDIIGVFFKPGVAVAAGGTIDLTAETWKGYKTITVTIENVPLEVADSPNFVFADLIAPYAAATWAGNFTFETTGSVKRGTATMDVYDIQALDVIFNVILYRPQTSSQQLAVRLAGGQNVTIDLGPKLLPWFTTGASPDAATNSMKWSQLPGAAPDYLRMDIRVFRPDATRYTWELAGPAGAGVLELPTLPGSFAAYNLQSTFNVSTDRLYLRRIPAGWDSVRSCALSPECYFPTHAQGDYSVSSGPDISP